MPTSYKYHHTVIGIDQSYSNTGISIASDGHLKVVRSIQLSKLDCNGARRAALVQSLSKALKSATTASESVSCVIERIRLMSGKESFINIDYIKSIGALNAVVVDTCMAYNVPVHSVDTRCWKSQVVGTSKPQSNKYGVPPEKWPTVRWCIDQGFESSILQQIETRKVKGTFERNGVKYMYNNDASDSAAIAMFGFIGDRDKLKLEH